LGTITASAATIGLGSLLQPLQASADPGILGQSVDDADEWFKKVKGKHKIVFDATEPNDVFPFAWPRVFLLTNEKTGTPPTVSFTATPLNACANLWYTFMVARPP